MPRSFSLQRRHLVPQKLVSLGPFRGVKDVGDAGSQDPAYLQDAINAYFPDPVNGGAVEARQGFTQRTLSGLNSSAIVQSIHAIYVEGSGYLRFVIAGGSVYRWSSGTTWTDVTPVGVTISTTASRIWSVTYNGEIIFNDGVNEPWRATALTSTPITGTEIEINTAGSAWAAYGKPTVHGGKLFFIVRDVAGTKYLSRIAWSEEATAATGYAQTGYTNFWDLLQTSGQSEIIRAIQGTNAGLYFFRDTSIGVILGSVNADFVTASTHDGVSNDVGIGNDLGDVLFAKDYIWFFNHNNYPCRFRLGSKVIEPLWQQMRHRIKRMQIGSVSMLTETATMVYSPTLNKVAALFLHESGSDVSVHGRNIYIFDADSGNYEGRWLVGLESQPASETPDAFQLNIIAAIPFSDGFSDAVGFTIGGCPPGTTTKGFIWSQAYIDGESFGDNSEPMHFSITPMLAPNEQVSEFRVDEIAIDAVPDSATMSLDYYTPRATVTGLSLTGITGADSIQSSHDHGRYVAGLNALGRWFRPVMHWNVPDGSTPYAFERAILKVRGFPVSPRAK